MGIRITGNKQIRLNQEQSAPIPHLADVGALVLLVQVLDHERPLGAVAALAVQLEALVLREYGVARAQDVPVPPPDP